MGPVIELDGLEVRFGNREILKKLTASLTGRAIGLLGPNGAGKSTLLKTIVGLMAPSTGRIVRHDLPRRAIAYLPQQAEIDRSFPITVFDTVALGLWKEIGLWGQIAGAGWRRVADALAHVGLEGFGRQPIAALSAGQFQRVLFARLLLQDAKLILLDEPFAAIDERTTEDLLAIIRQWHAEGRTVIAVLHDMDQVRQHFPQTLLLARETIGWGPTVEVLTADALRRARTLAQGWSNGHHHHAEHAA